MTTPTTATFSSALGDAITADHEVHIYAEQNDIDPIHLTPLDALDVARALIEAAEYAMSLPLQTASSEPLAFVFRYPTLQGEGSRPVHVHTFPNRTAARAWIAQQEGEFFGSSDYFLVLADPAP